MPLVVAGGQALLVVGVGNQTVFVVVVGNQTVFAGGAGTPDFQILPRGFLTAFEMTALPLVVAGGQALLAKFFIRFRVTTCKEP